MLNNAFLSIVRKDCGPDELLVRARRQGDIERVFPKAKVARTPYPADYLYRAKVPINDVVACLEHEIRNIEYGNFKDSVLDDRLHNAYLQVWMTMLGLQNTPPPGRGGRKRHRQIKLRPKR